jgi:hypothetical protein
MINGQSRYGSGQNQRTLDAEQLFKTVRLQVGPLWFPFLRRWESLRRSRKQVRRRKEKGFEEIDLITNTARRVQTPPIKASWILWMSGSGEYHRRLRHPYLSHGPSIALEAWLEGGTNPCTLVVERVSFARGNTRTEKQTNPPDTQR